MVASGVPAVLNISEFCIVLCFDPEASSIMNVVWLKRDVRLIDHEPLSLAAAEKLPCVVIYIYEPELLTSDTYGFYP